MPLLSLMPPPRHTPGCYDDAALAPLTLTREYTYSGDTDRAPCRYARERCHDVGFTPAAALDAARHDMRDAYAMT